jgi:hypothetical protein
MALWSALVTGFALLLFVLTREAWRRALLDQRVSEKFVRLKDAT